MRPLTLICTVVLLLGEGIVVRGAERTFPYEAIINIEDGENVRSGPGPKYYPTAKLRKGDRVMVHRHDPGGWCMIAPPPGSFSWVRAEYIQKSPSGDTGVLKSSGVVVHIGSSLNQDDVTTVQANLSKGDAVEILGEKNFNFEDGPRLMYKISPVRREWRWISRKSIDAADAFKSDPFPEEQPKKKRTGPVAGLDPDAFAKPVSVRPTQDEEVVSSVRPDSDQVSVRESAAASEITAADRRQLDAIDQQFREMIRLDPSVWNLDQLETQYSQLENQVDKDAMTNLVAKRMDAVNRYRKTYNEYLEFFRLSAQTKARDAQLRGAAEGVNPVRQPEMQPTVATPPSATTRPAASPPAAAAPAFDGAGVVQKMAQTFPGGPQYVLITPEGRMLSFLQPAPGVDLNRHVGQSMGIIGQRVRRNDWNADVITVRSLQPVQLRGSR